MIPGNKILSVSWIGNIPYKKALKKQRSLFELRKNGSIPDTLLLLEHPHVYTLGRRSEKIRLSNTGETPRSTVESILTDRGGETTYHGPGQLVAYPIINIRESRIGPVSYVRILEQAIIDTLSTWNIIGHRVVGKTGVWVGGEPGERPLKGRNPKGRKIAAIGIRVSAGISMHGFALNVNTDLSYYTNIVPCGMPGLDISSITLESSSRPTIKQVGMTAAKILSNHLQLTPISNNGKK